MRPSADTFLRRALVIVALSVPACGLPSNLSAQTAWELTPYRVQLVICTTDEPPFTPRLKADLARALVHRADTVFGPSWIVRASTGAEAVGLAAIIEETALDAAGIAPEWLEGDKVMFVFVSSSAAGFRFVARELDLVTRTWSAPRAGESADAAVLVPEIFRTVVAAFAPLAIIDSVEKSSAVMRLRAGALPVPDFALAKVAPGTVFRPVIRVNDRDGNPRDVRVVQWTYLLATEVNGDRVTCQIHTGVKNPLGAKSGGAVQQLALAVVAPQGSTRLELRSRADPRRVLCGYDVYASPPDSEALSLVGRTDATGSVMIGPAGSPLRILLVKNGAELLGRLPLVPGLAPLATAALPDDDQRLAIEGFITGLQESLVDTVAQREVLLVRIRARIAKGEKSGLEEARGFLAQLKRLPTRDQLAARLDERQKTNVASDARVRREIQKLFEDTREVIKQYLDPRQIEEAAASIAAAGPGK